MKRHYELIYVERGVISPQDFFQQFIDRKFDDEKIPKKKDIEKKYKINSTIRLIIQPCYYSTALKYFLQGKEFSFLIWQDFYQFIAEWLLSKGFLVRPPLKENGFMYIETIQVDANIGLIKCIWLLKKFSTKRNVGMKAIRELEYLVYKSEANKGMLVTTSVLTKKTLAFIKNNNLKYGFIDKKILEKTFQKKDVTL